MGDETNTDTAADTTTVLTAADDTGVTDENQNTDTNSDAAAAADESTKTDDGSGGGDTGSEGSQTPPDTYADFVMPEGVTLDETIAAEAMPIFKEMGATQEQAQKLMDLAAKQVQAGSQKQTDTFNQLMDEWQTTSKNDKEFGGDKFDENVKIAQNAVNKYGTPELKQLLEDHGVGNHPEVIRFMLHVGQTLKEDVPGSSGSALAGKTDRVSLMYPTNDK